MADTNPTHSSPDSAKKGQEGYGEAPHNPSPPATGPQSTQPKQSSVPKK